MELAQWSDGFVVGRLLALQLGIDWVFTGDGGMETDVPVLLRCMGERLRPWIGDVAAGGDDLLRLCLEKKWRRELDEWL